MSAIADDSPDLKSQYDVRAQTNLPIYLIDLKEALTVDLLKLQAQIADITRKVKWTQEEAASLVPCSVNTVKEAVEKGLLKTGTSKWITRPQLEEWLGFDPVEETIRRARTLEKQVREITLEIERRMENMENQLKLANSDANITPPVEK